MGRYLISTREGSEPVEVSAPNWLAALGIGLDLLGTVTSIDRLACEVLANGTVIARDVRTGTGFIVHAVDEDLAQGTTLEQVGAMPIASLEDEDEDDETFSISLGEDFDTHEEETLSALITPPADPAHDNSPPPVATRDTAVSEELWTRPLDDGDAPSPADDARLQAALERICTCETADSAWETALSAAQELVHCESGAALRREWDGSLRFVSAFGPQAHKLLGERLPAGSGIAGFCAQRRVSLVIQDPRLDPRFCSKMDRRTGYQTSCVVAVPVRHDTDMFGCLELLNAPQGFSQASVGRLVQVADELAHQLLVAV